MIIQHNTNKYFYLAIKKLFFKQFPPRISQLSQAFSILNIVLKGERLRLKTQKAQNTPIPYSAVFSVTWKCNLKCVGCYANNYPKEKQLETHEIKGIIEQANSLGVYLYIIVGGEPLMNPQLIDVLSENKNALFFLFTNGTLLNDEKVKKLKKSKHVIPILSTEGDASFIDFRRGSGMGATVNKALELFKKHKIIFGFSSMITHKSLNEVLTVSWMNSLWTYGARFGFIIDYIPFPRTLDESLILSDDDMANKRLKINEINEKSKISLFNFPENEYKKSGCKSAGNGFIHINANGFVEPCPFSHYAADNIRDKPILEILNSDFFKRLRSEFADKPNESNSCMLFQNSERVDEIARETGAFSTEKKNDEIQVADLK